jgi:asparagine synthetase B (glutamine-hydrolysing)
VVEIIIGNGSDELFAGYSFMENIADLDNYIKMWRRDGS